MDGEGGSRSLNWAMGSICNKPFLVVGEIARGACDFHVKMPRFVSIL